jgi:hypothetical protein
MSRLNKLHNTYSDAIEAVLKANGNIASLQTVYGEISNYRKLTGMTPFATIQERVQRDKRFTRIEKGVYALTDSLKSLPQELINPRTAKDKIDRLHYRIQGMLLEIGNCLQYKTFCANKKGQFAGKALIDYSSLPKLPPFTYDHILRRAKNIDLIWFNAEEFPYHLYEVDTGSYFQRSLLKFMDLKYFHAEYKIVSSKDNIRSFKAEMNRPIFNEIKSRTRFVSYNQVEFMYDSSLKQLVASKEFL